jgi:CDP-diacylglycerol--glycerol-3-phosphate 3-phosphatidyltransferase
MTGLIDFVRQIFIRAIRVIAKHLNRITKGRLHPNAVTLFGLAMHVPIALLIITNHWVAAACALFIFGLLDKLDGELARLQGRESANGMLLDSVTDRVKEVILYVGVAYVFVTSGEGALITAAVVAALGCSLLTSYLNAMGDAIMARHAQTREHSANKVFRSGIFAFEVRMAVLFVGLLTGQLAIAIVIITLGAAYTALGRLLMVYSKLAVN